MRLWRPQPEPLGAVRRAATPLGSVQWGLSVVVAPWWLRPRVARVSRTEAGRPAGPGLRPWGLCSRLLPSPGSEGQEAPRRVLSDLSCHRGRSSRGRGRLAGGPHRVWWLPLRRSTASWGGPGGCRPGHSHRRLPGVPRHAGLPWHAVTGRHPVSSDQEPRPQGHPGGHGHGVLLPSLAVGSKASGSASSPALKLTLSTRWGPVVSQLVVVTWDIYSVPICTFKY